MRFQHCAALLALALSSAASIAPVTAQQAAKHDPGSFTIAVIPDTQNYLDYAHQTEAGFPFDARERNILGVQGTADHFEMGH